MKTLTPTPQKMLVLLVAMALVVFMFTAMPVLAQVTGPCVDCHTMHNSQGGTSMATTWDDNPDTLPNERLLKRDGCISCHRGTYSTATGDMMDSFPKVWDDSAAMPDTYPGNGCSAGGNFKWVAVGGAANDAKGHNVAGISTVDNALSYAPPGYGSGTMGPEGTTLRGGATGFVSEATMLTCAGTYGCHGDPSQEGDFPGLSGAHHGVQGPGGFTSGLNNDASPGLSISNSYRFLYGIKGVEDPDWEYTVTHLDHNQYHGINRGDNTEVDDTTISHLCCECHGDFHAAQQGGTDSGSVDGEGNPIINEAGYVSPWNRHPTDFDMNETASGSEYKKYNEQVSLGQYSTLAPVGSDMSLTAYGATIASELVTTNIFVANKAIVTCISCHRAHGSEFDDLLRWNYNTRNEGSFDSGTEAASGDGVPTSGCFVCHTTKDDNS